MLPPSLLAVSYFFHLIATVVWLGGLALFVLMVWPEVRRVLSDSPVLYALLNRLRKRFYPLTNYSLLVLIVTGMFQMPSDPHYDGFLTFANDWSTLIVLKHVGVVGMVICGLVIQYSIVPSLERTSLLLEHGKADSAEYERLRRREVRLTWANIVLALGVLACTAWATSL